MTIMIFSYIIILNLFFVFLIIIIKQYVKHIDDYHKLCLMFINQVELMVKLVYAYDQQESESSNQSSQIKIYSVILYRILFLYSIIKCD